MTPHFFLVTLPRSPHQHTHTFAASQTLLNSLNTHEISIKYFDDKILNICYIDFQVY